MTVYKDRWVVISGVRDLAPESVPLIRTKMAEIIHSWPRGLIFGGARGVDTAALRYADAARLEGRGLGGNWPRLVVVVPGVVDGQPRACAKAIRECADETIELRLPLNRPASFHERNAAMIREALWRSEETPAGPPPILVAFAADGALRGGTGNAIAKAVQFGVEVERVTVSLSAGRTK